MSTEYRRSSGNGNPFDQFAEVFQPGPQMFTRMMQPMLSANASMIGMQSKMWHTAAEASREWCDFVSKRLEKDAQFLHKLQDSQDPQDFMDTCAQFSRRMAQDYQEEFSELSRLSSKAAGTASEVMRETTEQVGSEARRAAEEAQRATHS
jgi:histone H3/H4